ncbi:MAG TPA: NAD(P)/FAD-dependent oxidoreductase [Deltaproteobacteria bacterium]|nr:NAD(P)/FAD-dependent oxidoreductase [Deltaproteobacteria bacterium]
MGAQLERAGVEDFLILERGDGLGGTWRVNTYPGAACDVPSHLYSFSFAPKPDWSRRYAPQAEILDYIEGCAERFGVGPHVRAHTEVTDAAFDEATGRWRVQTGDGRRFGAAVVVLATGGLSRPRVPRIPGLDTFAGPVMHSAGWRHDLDLDGLRVGVVGTGASAIQVVPGIVDRVGQLLVFQRTPPWILPRGDRAFTAIERAALERILGLRWLYRQWIYWTTELAALAFVRFPGLLRWAGHWGTAHLHRQIEDPALRRALTPGYTMGCKRILLSDDYYPALASEHTALVTSPIEAIDVAGVCTADGVHHPLDALILCTGFHAAEQMAPFPIRGRAGRSLSEVWASGASAYLGTAVHGFPNLFLLVGPNTGLGHSSMIFVIESQVRFILGALDALRRRDLVWMDVRSGAQERFNRWLQRRMGRTVWQQGGCRSWYQTSDGRNTTLWPGFTFDFARRTRRPRLADFELRARSP